MSGIAVIVGLFFASMTPPEEPQRYADPFLGYLLRLPPGWTEGTMKEGMLIFRESSHADSPQLKIQVKKDAKPLKDFLDAFRKTLIEASKGAKISGETPFKGGKAEGVILNIESGSQRMLFAIFGHGGKKFVYSFVAEDGVARRLGAAIEQSMRSVRIFDAPDLSAEDRERYRKAYDEGTAFLKERKWSEAEAAFRKASALVPDFPDVHVIIGMACRMAGKLSESVVAYEKAIAVDPENLDALAELGALLVMKKEYAKAVERLERALTLDPENDKVLCNLGIALVLQQKYAKAVDILQKAIAADPKATEARYHLAFCFEMQKKIKEAEELYRKVLELNPDHEGAKEGFDRLKKGKK